MSNENTEKKTSPAKKQSPEKQPNIYQRMLAITAELRTVAKNLDVQAGKGNSYKAVSERDIIDAVKPLEEKHGVYSYPCDREILEATILESETQYGKKTSFFTRIKTTYMFVNVDNPDEKITTITFSEGIDPQDKGSGKAMTYADKYALMKAYKISTGDDPDQNPSEPEGYTRTPAPNPQQKPAQQVGTKCVGCGGTIREATRTDGSTMTASEVAYFGIKRFGAPYCTECQKMLQQQRNAARNNQEG